MKKLIYILFVLITIAFVVAAIAGFATGRINPEGKEWISFPGLVLLPVLAANLCLFLMWCVFRSHWCWVPLAALLLNWEFLISMFQIRVFPKEIPIGKEAVKVITYNVNNFNTDGKKQLPNIADWLRKEDPDIVCLQECPVESALRMDSVAKTLSFLPYYCSTRSATKAAGNAIFSKYPILRFESILYPESSNKSLFAVMDIQGDSVRVFNNHFQTTSVNAVKPRLYQAHAECKQLEETEAAFHMAFQMKKNFVKRATQMPISCGWRVSRRRMLSGRALPTPEKCERRILMQLHEIRKALHGEAYDFLRTNPHLGSRVMLLGLGGSHAYGTDTETSDLDIRGCAVLSKAEILCGESFEQVTDVATDTTIYAFPKLIHLLKDCNPNTIELIGLKPEHYLYLSEAGKLLLDNRKLFLSQLL